MRGLNGLLNVLNYFEDVKEKLSFANSILQICLTLRHKEGFNETNNINL